MAGAAVPRALCNPLVLVLLAASVVSAATGDAANFAIIMLMALLSARLDFVQEHRAGRAADALRESVALRASVLRDGRVQEVPVSALVPGDLVLLSAGNHAADVVRRADPAKRGLPGEHGFELRHFSKDPLVMLVRIAPGEIALARIPRGSNSLAM